MKNDLLNKPGFKRCKHHTTNHKTLTRMIHQAKLKNFRNRPVYQYGFQVPRNHDEAVFIDNTFRRDARLVQVN
jgi:hypothetical protein